MSYVSPEVKDYGDLVALTADTAGMAHLGFGTIAAVSSPVVAGAGGGDALGASDAGGTLGDTGAGGDVGADAGDTAGAAAGSDPSGGSSGSGSGSGGGGGGGGAAGTLPFTGFAAAAVGALGAGLTAAGATARKYLRRG